MSSGLLDPAPAEPAEAHPDTRVRARHLSTAEQLVALQNGELDVCQWVGFPHSGSPAWYDEPTAILRGHGHGHGHGHGRDLGPDAPQGRALIADVKPAAVMSGRAFTLAPPGWQQPLPDRSVSG